MRQPIRYLPICKHLKFIAILRLESRHCSIIQVHLDQILISFSLSTRNFLANESYVFEVLNWLELMRPIALTHAVCIDCWKAVDVKSQKLAALTGYKPGQSSER